MDGKYSNLSPTYILGHALSPTKSNDTQTIYTSKTLQSKIHTKSLNDLTVNYHSRPMTAYNNKRPKYIKKKRHKNSETFLRPLSANFFTYKDVLKQSLKNDKFTSIFSDINSNDKPRFLVTAKSGTIYEDWRSHVNTIYKDNDKLKHQVLRELEQLYEKEKYLKHKKYEQRLKILNRFRLKRIQNTLKYKNLGILYKNPIIFIPDKSNPFNPNNVNNKENNNKLNRLSQPKFVIESNIQQNIPFDKDDKEVKRQLNKIKSLKNIRNKYNWKSLLNYSEYEYNSDDSYETNSTTSTASNINDIYCDRNFNNNIKSNNNYTSNNNDNNQIKYTKQVINDINEFEKRLNYINAVREKQLKQS